MQGIATSVFLNSFGTTSVNQGITVKELKLQMLMPGSFNHNSINTGLDELQNKAYYLHYSQTGGSEQRFWFHTKPNLNILVNNALSEIKNERIESNIINLLERNCRNVSILKILIDPKGEVPEQKTLSLVILHPSLYRNGNRKFDDVITEIALRKGSTDRIYRNTILFLSVSSHGRLALYNEVKEYLACIKIEEEYRTTLEQDQKRELKTRIDEAERKMQRELVTAYGSIHKYSASKGIQTYEVRQFAESLDRQISINIYAKLKDEELLLESIGLNTLRKNNLLPVDGNPVQVTRVVEAFIRFDDKPMITDRSAVKDSLTKYCYNKQFAIASRSSKGWTQMFFGNTVPMFDVEDETYWLVSPADYEEWRKEKESAASDTSTVTKPAEPGGNGNI